MKTRRLFSFLLLAGLLPLSALATIVDGERQKPTFPTQGFVTDQEVYMLNVGSGLFFTQGNYWGTQASVGSEPRLVKFQPNSAYDYTMLCYNTTGAWSNVFFDSDKALYVDRNNQANYFFAVEENGNTFRLSTSQNNPTYGDYSDAGLYVGLMKNSTSTALSPFVEADEAYVDWAIVTKEDYDGLSATLAIYDKAQELKSWIDRIEAENGDASSFNSVYLNEASTMEELQAAIDGALRVYAQVLIDNAENSDNVDVTVLLKNPDFEQSRIHERDTYGWITEAAPGGGNVRTGGTDANKCYEAWGNDGFDIYQVVTAAPLGVYEIEVHGFYRYSGGETALEAYYASLENGKPIEVPVYVYMNNNATPLKNYFDEQVPQGELYTDDTSLLDTAVPMPPVVDKFGYWYPNDMNNCATAFNSGLYAQSAYGLVARNGDVLRIGVKGVSNQGGGSWPIWDNFRLIYRGFKPEVVQPVLEQAISDCDNLKSYLMGKTEYAALTKAFADAAKAIEENDGEAMLNALNALYDAKDPALLSKDLFLDQEVPADTVRLAEAIADVAGEKLSKATLQEAQTLLAAIKGNTKYEGTEIDQLKSDVTAAINAINSSVATYASLNEAIVAVKESVAKKAYQTLIDEASEQLTVAEAGYETGSLTDAQAKAQTEALWSKQNELTASIEAYANLAAAITRLQNAVTEASAETQHVAQSTLRKANLRLTASQKLYDEGTIATADIEARVKTIDELITELTRSIELYKQFAAGLEKLAAELEKGDKVSAQVLESASQLYATAKQAYDEGTTDDDAVEATVKELEAATASLTASAALYKSLAEAIPSLEEAVTQKAYQPLLDEATQLLTSVKDGYENASIEDANVNTTIENINAKVEAINASATEYAKLKAAIDRLTAAIEEVGETATKSSLKKANLRLTASQRLYNEGTIADADIEARVTSIDELIESLTASVRLRQQYDAAIASLDAAVDGAQGNVGEAMMQNAQALQTTIKTDYAEGNVSDENVPAEIAKIENIVTALEAAHDAYQLASQKQQEIAEAEAAMADALSAIDTAETDANEAHLTGAYLEQATAAIADGRQGLGQLQAQLASLKDKTNNLLISLNGVTLTEGDTPVNSIKEELAAVDASAIATSATELATATVATVMACIPTAVAYDEADDNLPYISDTDLANVTITRTIKEGFNTVVLPFSLTASQVTAAFGAGTQIYTFFENSADANNATVCFYKVAEGTIAANVPVLVKATAASTEQVFEGVQIVAPVADVKTGGTNFDFVGVYAPATLEKGDFFIGNGAIYKSTGETSIKAFRAYIDNKSGAAAARIVIDGEEVTAIDGMEMGGNRIGKAHNLQGMEVNTPQKGLYIVNGKKIVVK